MAKISRRVGRALSIAALAVCLVTTAKAQSGASAWVVFTDGERTGELAGNPTDPEGAARSALAARFEEGHLHAVVDSVVMEDGRREIHVAAGPVFTTREVSIEGMSVVEPGLVAATLATRPGSPLSPTALEADLGVILRALERAGRPMASAEVVGIEFDGTGAHVTIRVEEGDVHRLAGVELVPAGRTQPAFAARLAGMRPGEPLSRYDPVAIRRDLEASGLFDVVGEPELVSDREGQLVLRIPVEEAQPGAVDLVLGYLPPGVAGQTGTLVGSGSIVLRNLFGQGRRLSLKLDRNPGLVSAVDARIGDPYLLGLPVSAELRFSGYQQDSTFSRQSLGLEVGYRVAPGFVLFAVGTREAIEAGVAGAALVDGRPRVAGASAWFAGAGARFTAVDHPLNPRSGLAVESLLEQGVKRRTLPAGSEESLTVRQQRLRAVGRLFIPTLARQILVLGADGAVILGEAYDDSDLLRFGGATSLRGYDEEQFRGNVAARGLVEYRYLLDPTSFAFAFFDLGYVARPETPGVPASERVLPGYGIGLQYRTPLGLVTASFGMNPDDGPTRGKVHVGLSVGL